MTQPAAQTDTIYASATAAGRGGVAVIRLSGPAVKAVIEGLTGNIPPEARQVVLRKIIHPVSRETIDEGLVLFFEGPASYTGEDVAEFHVHGGLSVQKTCLAALSTFENCRMAEPGEFTRRAFENGKMDLTAAEAVADLVDAETDAQRLQALDQLGGGLSRLYNGWREALARQMAHIEADIDFPDEDLPQGILEQVHPALEGIKAEIEEHLNDNRRGERLRDGIHIVVLGAPNAGKSSLVNALAKRELAIVSDTAGTTRDVIEAHLNIGGYPVILSDTAGLRPEQLGNEGHDAIESEGIRRALERAQKADIRLLVFDGQAEQPDENTQVLQDKTSIAVINKSDAGKGINLQGALPVSAQTGAGLDVLVAALKEKIETLVGRREGPTLTRQRHRENLEHCVEALERALSQDVAELAAEDMRLAIRHIGRITGRVDVEELLDVIFRDFCIGK